VFFLGAVPLSVLRKHLGQYGESFSLAMAHMGIVHRQPSMRILRGGVFPLTRHTGPTGSKDRPSTAKMKLGRIGSYVGFQM
jgi:hypothetical protein